METWLYPGTSTGINVGTDTGNVTHTAINITTITDTHTDTATLPLF